jgi:hypothetical protein
MVPEYWAVAMERSERDVERVRVSFIVLVDGLG